MSTIEYGAFARCTVLKKMALPEGLTQISSSMFAQCKSMTEIYIPGTVVTVGKDAFDRCAQLNKTYFGGTEEMWNNIVIDASTSYGSTGNKYLTTDIMNRYWNQTAASIV